MHERVRSRVLQLDAPLLELRASDWNNRPHEQPVENGANFLGWQRAGGGMIRCHQKFPRGHALQMLLCIAQRVPLLLQQRAGGGRHEESSSGKVTDSLLLTGKHAAQRTTCGETVNEAVLMSYRVKSALKIL